MYEDNKHLKNLKRNGIKAIFKTTLIPLYYFGLKGSLQIEGPDDKSGFALSLKIEFCNKDDCGIGEAKGSGNSIKGIALVISANRSSFNS